MFTIFPEPKNKSLIILLHDSKPISLISLKLAIVDISSRCPLNPHSLLLTLIKILILPPPKIPLAKLPLMPNNADIMIDNN